jgi:hypothetical protein
MCIALTSRCVRTTLDIDDAVLRELKKKANAEGRTLQAVVNAHLSDLAEDRAPWAIPWPCVYEFLWVVTLSTMRTSRRCASNTASRNSSPATATSPDFRRSGLQSLRLTRGSTHAARRRRSEGVGIRRR